MPKILIAGYPKSGTTYVSRLVANVLSSPLVGYWGSNHNEIARTGLDRSGPFRCYKGHQHYNELNQQSIDKLIYVVRDPRAVTVSAAHYFAKPLLNSKTYFSSLVNFLHWNTIGKNRALKNATNALLMGDASFDQHMKHSWSSFHRSYQEQSVFTLRYEDALAKPEKVCEQILNLVGLKEDPEIIAKAIEDSAFESMRQEFKRTNNKEGLYLLRKGKKDSWKRELPRALRSRITKDLEVEIQKLGYPISV